MSELAFALREQPQIIELLAVLEQNGLTKEREEVSSLVEYIGSMEETLAQIRSELQEMHGEVKEIQDKGLQAQCSRVLGTAQEKVMQTGEMVSTVKTNFVRAAGNAVRTFRAKGRAALDSDKGILAKLRKSLEDLGRTFAAMGDRSGDLEETLQKDRPAQKPSVKTSLRVLKSGQAAKASAPVQTEQVR